MYWLAEGCKFLALPGEKIPSDWLLSLLAYLLEKSTQLGLLQEAEELSSPSLSNLQPFLQEEEEEETEIAQ